MKNGIPGIFYSDIIRNWMFPNNVSKDRNTHRLFHASRHLVKTLDAIKDFKEKLISQLTPYGPIGRKVWTPGRSQLFPAWLTTLSNSYSFLITYWVSMIILNDNKEWVLKWIFTDARLIKLETSVVSVRVSVAEIKHRDQTGEEGYSTYISMSQLITEDTQGRNSNGTGIWRWELMQWPWRGAANWLAPYGFHS